MKRLLPLFAVALACWVTNSAAADLNIKFTGKFVTSTCSFAVPDTDLGTYGAWTFTGSTSTPIVRVPITATNCTPDITVVHMRFSGTPDSTNSAYYKAQSTNGASGVAIWLQNGLNVLLSNNVMVDWPLAGLGTTYIFNAKLVQTGHVTPGTIKSPITIQFTYN